MKEWSSLITAAMVGGFGYLTAMATLSTKKVDSSSEMTKTSFDVILKRLEHAEKELDEFKKLQSKYDKIKNDYDSLKQENADLIRRVGELEAKRGRK